MEAGPLPGAALGQASVVTVHTAAMIHSRGHSRGAAAGAPEAVRQPLPGRHSHPRVPPALPALQLLPWPSQHRHPQACPTSHPSQHCPPHLRPLPTSDAAPAPHHPSEPPPGCHPQPTLAGRTPAVSQPLSRLPGPCLGSLSRPSRAQHRVSTGHRGAKQTSRQAGAKGTSGAPPSAPSPRCSNTSSRRLPVVWGHPAPSHLHTPLYPVRVDRAHCRQCSFINSSTQEAGTRAPNKPLKGE